MRKELCDEAIQAVEMEARIQARLDKWIRITFLLGMALVVTIITVIPFRKGFALHFEWDRVGKKVLLLAMCLLPVFMYAVGTTYIFGSTSDPQREPIGGSRRLAATAGGRGNTRPGT